MPNRKQLLIAGFALIILGCTLVSFRWYNRARALYLSSSTVVDGIQQVQSDSATPVAYYSSTSTPISTPTLNTVVSTPTSTASVTSAEPTTVPLPITQATASPTSTNVPVSPHPSASASARPSSSPSAIPAGTPMTTPAASEPPVVPSSPSADLVLMPIAATATSAYSPEDSLRATLVISRPILTDGQLGDKVQVDASIGVKYARYPVKLTFHSEDPIVIETVTDENGELHYVLDTPLATGEEHQLAISLVDPVSGKEVVVRRSFFLDRVEAAGSLNTAQLADPNSALVSIQIGYFGVMVLLVAGGVLVAYLFVQRWTFTQSALLATLYPYPTDHA